MISLQQRLAAGRDSGKKLLVPYITGGVRDDWLDIVQACDDAGADAVEIGFPFSDPVMDGPVIQSASMRALDRGTTPTSLFAELAGRSFSVPLAVMTYANLVYRYGYSAFAADMVKAGISGAIIPDLPVEASEDWFDATEPLSLEPVLLVAPNSSDDRLRMLATRSKGFVYTIGMLGVTGERDELARSAALVGARVKAVATIPVLLGIGISTPAQAAEASASADGVIVGSAVVRRIMDDESPAKIGEFIAELRAALDS